MEREYDFSKGVRNPYAARLREKVTIQVDSDTLTYFQQQAEETGIPCQRLINAYLRDCMKHKRTLTWE